MLATASTAPNRCNNSNNNNNKNELEWASWRSTAIKCAAEVSEQVASLTHGNKPHTHKKIKNLNIVVRKNPI